jgi:uncharacterized membrane protein
MPGVLGKIGVVLLVAWVVARAFTNLGSTSHLLLLSGLMLLLIAFVQARDKAGPDVR